MKPKEHTPARFINALGIRRLGFKMFRCAVTIFIADVMKNLDYSNFCWRHNNLVALKFHRSKGSSPFGSQQPPLHGTVCKSLPFTLIWKELLLH